MTNAFECDNMYSYDYVTGDLLSNVLDDNILKDILNFYKIIDNL